MSATKSPTGSDLPDTFIEGYRRGVGVQRMSLAALMRAAPWPSTEAFTEQTRAYRSHPRTSGTVALHVREGLPPRMCLPGIVAGGTVSDAASSRDVLSGRGELMLLDAWRVRPDGEHMRMADIAFANVEQIFLAEIKFSGDTGDWRLRAASHGAEGAAVPAGIPEAVSSLEDSDGPAVMQLDSDGAAGTARKMETMARAMTDVPAAIVVSRPEFPELSGASLEDAKRLFALTAGQLADIFGVTERQMRRYLSDGGLPASRRSIADGLTAIGLTVGPGLGPQGAREWLYSGRPPGNELARDGRIAELAERADALRDSPFT